MAWLQARSLPATRRASSQPHHVRSATPSAKRPVNEDSSMKWRGWSGDAATPQIAVYIVI